MNCVPQQHETQFIQNGWIENLELVNSSMLENVRFKKAKKLF